MTNESKLIIASNLTNAALLREQIMQAKGSPVMQTQEVIMRIFEEFVDLLDKKYPEK